jgi:hypothetical protein
MLDCRIEAVLQQYNGRPNGSCVHSASHRQKAESLLILLYGFPFCSGDTFRPSSLPRESYFFLFFSFLFLDVAQAGHSNFFIDERYTNLKPIGDGSYGFVCSAVDSVSFLSGSSVAFSLHLSLVASVLVTAYGR